jgi:hypothetical protein
MLRWAKCGFHKKSITAHDAELEFLHPAGYAGHVELSGAYVA